MIFYFVEKYSVNKLPAFKTSRATVVQVGYDSSLPSMALAGVLALAIVLIQASTAYAKANPASFADLAEKLLAYLRHERGHGR